MITDYKIFNENQLQLDLFSKKMNTNEIISKNNIISKKLNTFLNSGFNNQNLKNNIISVNSVTSYYTEKNNTVNTYNVFKIEYIDKYLIFKMYNKPFNSETNLPFFGLQGYVMNILRNDISMNIPYTTLQITKENEFYIFEFNTVYNAATSKTDSNEAVYTIEPQPLKSKKQVILNKNKSVDTDSDLKTEVDETIDENVNTNFDLNNLNIRLENKWNNNMMYWDDVYVNDIKIGNVRRQQQIINLDTRKVGRTRTYTYYNLAFDTTIAHNLFNVPINNYSNRKEGHLNSTTLTIPFTVKKIKTYLIKELTELYNNINFIKEGNSYDATYKEDFNEFATAYKWIKIFGGSDFLSNNNILNGTFLRKKLQDKSISIEDIDNVIKNNTPFSDTYICKFIINFLANIDNLKTL